MTAQEVLQAWNLDRDFLIEDIGCKDNGKFINKHDADKYGVTEMSIRYKDKTEVCFLKKEDSGWILTGSSEDDFALKGFKVGEEAVFLDLHEYNNNGRMAITLVTSKGEPFCTLTCNLPDEPLEDGEFFVKTWSENEVVAKAARESKLFIDTGKRVPAGHAQAEVWRLANGGTG